MANLTADYEIVLVYNGSLDEEGLAALQEKFKTLIAENGTVGEIEDWGKRRFSYEIDHMNDGYYQLIHFNSGPDFIKELDRVCNITDGIVRWLTTKKES